VRPGLGGLLLDHERERVARAAPALRDRTATGLLLARLVVAADAGVAADAVRLRRRCPRCGSAAHGVPWAERADGGPVPRLSLSRTDGVVAVALAEVAVGVDVERLTPAAIGTVALAPGEPPAAPGTTGLLRTWARKEAVLKAAGTGLTRDPADLRVTSATGTPEVVGPAPPPGRAWWLVDVDPAAGVVGAVAALRRSGDEPELDVRDHPLPAP
jgi:4'-phosphopantetheinyl transferase